MGRKEEYKLQNEQFMQALRAEADVYELPCGILYKVLEEGSGTATPRPGSVVSVHYRGTLINGREFDNSWKRNCPEAFRLDNLHPVYHGVWDTYQWSYSGFFDPGF